MNSEKAYRDHTEYGVLSVHILDEEMSRIYDRRTTAEDDVKIIKTEERTLSLVRWQTL